MVVIPCGTACAATYFASDAGQVDGPSGIVFATDIVSRKAAIVADNKIILKHIFSTERSRCVRLTDLPDSGEALSMIEDVVLEGEAVKVAYREASDSKEITRTFTLGDFQAECP